ncbi:MAG: DUF2330 domain-containing protein [Archangium sp.]|nr:DUF2330 domain-containing protein [Archangium sp.]
MLERFLLFAVPLVSVSAQAFCGFYVAGGGASLFNDATQVVLMREGTKTVLSMQNNYRGPPENFAMVIPVPIVLQKENVKTLTKNIFDKVDQLAAPRLVEYWEQDPCYVPRSFSGGGGLGALSAKAAPMRAREDSAAPRDYGVQIEAQFTVGEYEIVVLSAKDALGLEAWLSDNKYKIPDGAAPIFRPYIQQGMKFFVARVDVTKVSFKDGIATLSPLRFHYDSEKFELPIRLGLINAKGEQDLIVHVLARNQRYEVANYPNATIPTNIDLVPSAKSEFGPFYVSLYEKTLKKNPKAVVTEYAWDSSTCDPCPTPPLSMQDLMLLGLDVVDGGGPLPEVEIKNRDLVPPEELAIVERGIQNVVNQVAYRRMYSKGGARFVLTRLHARYDKTSAGEDLVFKAATPIAGGREFLTDGKSLEQGAVSYGTNNFQARYAIRYPWEGAISCANPQRGRWGGPPQGGKPRPVAAEDLGLVKADAALTAKLVESPVSEFGLKGKKDRAGIPLAAQGKK